MSSGAVRCCQVISFPSNRRPNYSQSCRIGISGDVGRRHRVIAQAVRRGPCQRLALAALRDAFPFAAGEQRHQQVKVVVAVAGEGQRRETTFPGADAQFLVQFADQAGFRGLTRLLPCRRGIPRARPSTCPRAVCASKHAAIAVDQCDGGDEHDAGPAPHPSPPPRGEGNAPRPSARWCSRPVVGVDGDVAVRQIAGPDGRLTRADADIDADFKLGPLHVFGTRILGVIRTRPSHFPPR